MKEKRRKGELRQALKNLFLRHYVLTTKEAQAKLEQLGFKVSLVSLYAELKKLLLARIIIKEGLSYALSLAWILDARSALESVYTGFLASPHARQAFGISQAISSPKPQRWILPSLYQANQLWVQLIFTLLSRTKAKQVYEYVPRLWFAYIETSQDSQFQRSFRAYQADIKVIVGGDSVLDRAPFDGQRNSPAYQCIFQAHSKFTWRNLSLCLVDQSLITIKYSTRLAKDIDSIFNDRKLPKDQSIPKLLGLLMRKERVTITLEHATRRVAAIRRRFESELASGRK